MYAIETKYIITVDISIKNMSDIIIAVFLKIKTVRMNFIIPYSIPNIIPIGIEYKNAIDC